MNSQKKRVAICGYGNLGKGVEQEIQKSPDMELKMVFTRRKPEELVTRTGVPAVSIAEAEKYVNDIDVVIMCGGSKEDLPEQVPHFARMFHTVDSFDTHGKIVQYLDAVDQAAKEGGHVSIISVGWDPGLNSLFRVVSESILPQGKMYTVYGRGVSQGHSDAIRKVKGVKRAVQYTVPIESAMAAIRNKEMPDYTSADLHLRDCYVVLEEGADPDAVKEQIVTMEDYFAEYKTQVHFLTEEELVRDHSGMPHGGFAIRIGETGEGRHQIMEFTLKLDSNPEFTSSVLIAYARAAYRLAGKETGARTVLDIPPVMLHPGDRKEIIKGML